MSQEPRVKFIELMGFAPVINVKENKINTELFLKAANEIIKIIGKF